MTEEQFKQVQVARELLKQAYKILDVLETEVKDSNYHPYIEQACNNTFESLVSNLNKVEHDYLHDN